MTKSQFCPTFTQSIYGDEALLEKIPGKLWEINLQLPQLEDLLLQQINDPGSKSKVKQGPTRKQLEQDPNVCQWFLRYVFLNSQVRIFP